MSRLSLALLLCWLSCWAPSLSAAEEASALTERDFVAAVAGNPATEAALVEERDLAKAALLRAAILPNPSLEASREEPGGAATETTVTLRWPLPRPDRRALSLEVAEKGLAAGQSRLDAARFALHLELRAVYAGWAVAWHRRDLLVAQLEPVKGLAGKEQARAEAGEVSGLAARRLALEVARARSELARAESEVALARAAVAAWFPALPPEARPLLPAVPALPLVLPELYARPDLVARQRELEKAEAQARLSRKVLEAPSLALGWKDIEERGGSASGPVVAFDWAIPVFDRRQAESLEAGVRVAAASAELELAQARARGELAGALAAYQGLRQESEQADLATAGLAALSGAAEAAYRAGEMGLTDLLDTWRATHDTRLAALALREAALAAARDLDAVIGASLSPGPGGLP